MFLKINSLDKKFESHIVFDKAEFTFSMNSVNVLMGFSGSGKTTLINILAGLEKSDAGIFSSNINSIGYCFQNDCLFSWLTIEKNLEFCGISTQNINTFTHKFGLSNLLKLYPNQLSGGQKQKINILRAFAKNPEYIFLDEPLSHIDSLAKEEFIQFIKELILMFKTTIIYITHDLDEALLIGENISYLCKKSKRITTQFENKFSKHSSFLELKNDTQYLPTIEQFYKYFKESNS